MSIIKWFNKPKWQNPNIQVRITAIQTSQDNELINSLEEIVNNDPSTKVQKTALSRIQDPESIVRILSLHPDKAVKNQASKKLIHWFAENNEPTQLSVFDQITETDTIKTLAEKAINPAVRKQALNQIKQQGLLGELLFTEQDQALQALILEKIDQPSTLRRMSKKASKKDQRIKQLIDAKLAGNDTVDQSKTAITICLQLEEVVHGRNTELDLSTMKNNWQEIEAHVPESLKLRYNGAYAAAKMILDPEHRSQFLKKQKQQRIVAVLNELEQTTLKQQTPSLQPIQAAIAKIQEIDTSDLNESELSRYQNINEHLIQARDKIQRQQQIPEAVTDTLDQINQLLSQPIVQPDKLTTFKKLWSKNTRGIKQSESLKLLEEQFSNACLKLAEKIEQSAQLRQQAAEDAIAMIEPTILQIKEGHLSQAKVMTNQIAKLKKTAGFHHPIIKQNKYQLDAVWQQLKDLRNWQKWSNDKARQDIINELHAMIGKAQHPDAVLKKLKDSNERWYALEDMEKLPGDKFPSRNQKMWNEFRIVSKALFEPTQPFFEKRSEQQDSFLGDIQSSIQVMNETNLDETSERDLARLSREAITHLKSLDKLPPKQRGKTAKVLRAAINRIDDKLNQFYAAAEEKKRDLIKQAQALSETEDTYSAIDAAKNLQQQWKNAGIVKQHTERKLWKKFRQANDAVFNRRKDEKQQLDDQFKSQLKDAKALMAELTQSVKKTKGAEKLHALKAEVNKRWHELEKPEKLLSAEFSQLLQLIEEAIKQDQFKATVKVIKDKQKLDEIYSQVEQGKLELDQLAVKTDKLLTKELEAIFSQRNNDSDNQAKLAELLIQAEFLTGLETPEAVMDERMAYQVKILSERMSGEKGLNDHDQAVQWFDTWFTTGKADSQFIKANSKRIKTVIKAMTELVMK